MKAILEFNLPEDREEHETAIKAMEWKWALQSVDEYLRGIVKYGDDPIKAEFAENARKMLYDELDERGLKLHE